MYEKNLQKKRMLVVILTQRAKKSPSANSPKAVNPINPHNHKLKKEKTIMEKIKEITVQELVNTFEGKLADVSSDGDAMVRIHICKAHFGYDADCSELEIFTGNAVKEGYGSITFRISEEDTVEVYKDTDGKRTYYLVFNDGRMDDLEIIDTMMPMDN